MSDIKGRFVKGQSGNPLGKPKGIRNKIDVRGILDKLGCCPFTILADLAMNSRSEKVQCEAASELASYVAPKLKQIEHTGDAQMPFVVSLTFGSQQQNPMKLVSDVVQPVLIDSGTLAEVSNISTEKMSEQK